VTFDIRSTVTSETPVKGLVRRDEFAVCVTCVVDVLGAMLVFICGTLAGHNGTLVAADVKINEVCELESDELCCDDEEVEDVKEPGETVVEINGACEVVDVPIVGFTNISVETLDEFSEVDCSILENVLDVKAVPVLGDSVSETDGGEEVTTAHCGVF